MARLALRAAVGVLWAALVPACLGGQTGQPTSLECDSTKLSATAAWSDTTVRAAAEAFAGAYEASLQWQVEPRSTIQPTPVDLQDSIQLTVSYGDAVARRNCVDQLQLPVSVTLTTSATGITDSNQGTLFIERLPQGLVARLAYESKLVRLDATLPEAATGKAPSGSFDALVQDLPGASGTFGQDP